jgi:hypothetical protein
MTQLKLPIAPSLLPFRKDIQKFCRDAMKTIGAVDGDETLLPYHSKLIPPLPAGAQDDARLALHFLQHVLVDLVGHGWSIKVRGDILYLQRPLESDLSHSEYKELVRTRKLRDRNSQLLEPSVAKFIDSMERRELSEYGWHCIFSVMRDGQQLAQALKPITKLDGQKRLEQLSETIKPYIQFVERDVRCTQTGLLLTDIWRYFRHTWVNVYKTLPGRSVSILIRDAAAENHPVIGIAALGSAVAQQRGRDLWIGWDKDTITQYFKDNGTARDVKWVYDSLDNQIADIYIKDFVKEGVLRRANLKKPTKEVIDKLRSLSKQEIEYHRKYPHAAKSSGAAKDQDWLILTKSHLYRSKRAGLLADLLAYREEFLAHKLSTLKRNDLKAALQDKNLLKAISSVVRRIKADHVGIDMMDIIVCGAIPPYNALLGGKLVCSLLASPEVTKYISYRYGQQESVIASSMKGTGSIRKPQLVLLGTTSLYRGNSSQYNRIRIPAATANGSEHEEIKYIKLGDSEGFGLFQFSSSTFDVMETYLSRTLGGKRVNSIFGEGVNPLMRKLREALSKVGLPAEALLQHSNNRFIYGVPLATNFREILLGKQKHAKFIIPQTKPLERTEQLAEFWRTRWLNKRIEHEHILSDVASNTLVYPVTHKARVPLYKIREALEDNLEFEFE